MFESTLEQLKPIYKLSANVFDSSRSTLDGWKQIGSLGVPSASYSNSTQSEWKHAIWGEFKCINNDGSIQIFNESTKFPSICFIITLGVAASLLTLGPILYRVWQLSYQQRGKPTFFGQASTVLAVVCPSLFLGKFWLNDTLPAPIELLFSITSIVIASLHYVQDGRVNICSSELLVYWLIMSFVYPAFAIDSYLRLGLRLSSPLILAALFSVHIFFFELIAPERQPRNNYDDTSIFARVSISYAQGLMKKGLTDQIRPSDMINPPQDLDALSCYTEFENILSRRPKNSAHRVLYSLGIMIRFKLFWVMFFEVADLLVTLMIPNLTASFLVSLSLYKAGEVPIYKCYYLASLFGTLPLTSLAISNLSEAYTKSAENQTRAALMCSLYRKTMSLSPAAKERFEAAKIMNILNVDTNQLFAMSQALPMGFYLSLSLVFSTWQLWTFLGPSFFSAALVYMLVTPFSLYFSSVMRKVYPKLMKFKDERSKLTINALRCIKSIKLHAWESPSFKRIVDLRNIKEIQMMKKIVTATLGLAVFWNCAGDFVGSAVFTTFLWLKRGTLSADVVFPSLYLLQMASSAVMLFPQSLNTIIQGLNSEQRINEILIEDDHDFANYERSKQSANGFEEPSVIVKNAKISWNGDDSEDKIALKDVSFEATRSDLVCIVGRVGSGKTAFVRSLCGDLNILSGSIVVKGSLCYCSQEPWLQNLTLRDNILFGQELDEAWYKQVLKACELTEDINQMTNGDSTEIGERGLSLSGGQKARVALARAVYSRADVVILDDILSAVDEHVSSALIRNLFKVNGLLANRTIILATNNVKVLSHSSRIIALEEKRIVESNSFEEVVSKGSSSTIYKLIQQFGHADALKQNSKASVNRKEIVKNREQSSPDEFPESLNQKPANFTVFKTELVGSKEEEEEVLKSYSTVKRFLYVDRPWVVGVYFSVLIVSVTATNSMSFYFGFLANKNLTSLSDGKLYLILLVALAFFSASATALSQFVLTWFIGLRNSKILHEGMLWNVFRAPMKFFDGTPLGRLSNRFTGDLQTIDSSFPHIVYYSIRSAINLAFLLLAIISGTPSVLLIIVPLGWLTNRSRLYYVPTQRKVMRISTASNSPILAQIEDSLKGQLSIKSFDRLSQFTDLFDSRVNYWVKATFYSANLSLWLVFRLQMLTTVLQLSVAIASTQLVSKGVVGVGFVAVMLNLAERAGIMTKQSITLLASLETTGVALERIFDYIDIQQEAPAKIESTEPSDEWPNEGSIFFKTLSAKYSEDGPTVLNDLSLRIKGGEKVGIVGRTGSGKSTLTMTLFRLLEASAGHIEIDDVDISTLGLFDLRSRLSIIPQDAQIFDSSVRENLDPFNTVDDARIWEVLELCHLKNHFKALDGLDTQLTDSGSTLSRGQCQLLCLGRALIHKSKVLVLDEATASVDHETDSVVQETIRKNFGDRTIVTIAHRLNTIMDSDRIVVLDKGRIVEFDTPQNLLESKGLFYSLHNTELKEDKEGTDDAENP